MKYILMIAAAVVTVLCFTQPASADVDIGFNVDWNRFQDVGVGDWGVGGRIDAGGAVRFIGSFDYYFVDVDIFDNDDIDPNDNFDLRFYEIGANLAYVFPTQSVRPYLGGGLSISKRTFNNVTLSNFFDDNKTELGGNVFGGLKFGNGPVKPFLEVRGVFYGGDESFNDRFVLAGGILF